VIHLQRPDDFLKDYDESKHPRDERGRWASGGSGGASSPDISPGSRTLPSVMREASGHPNKVDIERLGDETTSVGTVYKATFKDGSKAVYKPEKGNGYTTTGLDEQDNEVQVKLRRDMDTSVPQYKKELATMEIDRELGFNRVPHVEVVDYGHGLGHAQAFIEGEVAANVDYNTVSNDVLTGASMQQVAALDMITGNTDRHFGNFMLGRDDDQWYAIDNGLTFPDKNGQFNSVPVRTLGKGGVSIHESVKASLAKFTPEKLDVIMSRNGIGKAAREQAKARLNILKTKSTWTGVAHEMIAYNPSNGIEF